MSYFIDAFGGVTLGVVAVYIAAIAFLAPLCVKLYRKIIKKYERKKKKEDTLSQIARDVKSLKEEQNVIKDSINELKTAQQEIAERQLKTEARSLNDLRDKLLSNWRYYTDSDRNPMHAWSDMEKEAFGLLFADYEEMGGNGFMHTTVQPALEALEVIPTADSERFTALMQSRKG